jgi:Zn-dependent protease with chaperone function
MIVRLGRWLLPLIFLLPLKLVADRFCWFGPTDDAYHGLVALHRVLPELIIAAGAWSIFTVTFRVAKIRDRLTLLATLSSDAPAPLLAAFGTEAQRLNVPVPRIVYVPTSLPLCFAGLGLRRSDVFLSRGFVQDLSAVELRLVAHHELVHLRDRHPAWNFVWHVIFAALVLPGFVGLERMLRRRRELAANVSAARVDPAVYEGLLLRRAQEHRSLCLDGEKEPRRISRFSAAMAPVAVVGLFVALGVSHADFMHDLPYLLAHHC